MRNLWTLSLLLFATSNASAQVNGHARISGISGNELYVAESNESYGQFDPGDRIILMQMQDNVIGSTTNDASFGSLGSIGMAGRYEVLEIDTVTNTLGELGMIKLKTPPTLPFAMGENSTVQAITFEFLGNGGDYTTTEHIIAVPWNGNIGGVIALQVQGSLVLRHGILANGAGFRGGLADQTVSGTCAVSTFRSTKTERFAYKGEGVHRNTDSGWEAAIGRLLNGGGGGNDHNGGGGGGGNFTGGGTAGPGYNCGAGHAGGIGGLGLGAEVTPGRIFMGGGGGGGEGNDNNASSGGSGGGIILIEAASVITTGTCSGVTISANGANASDSNSDGAGGAGAGGSIIIQSPVVTFNAGCPVTIQASGGNGGRVNHPTIHGGGGGGGQGVVIFSHGAPGQNVSVIASNGAGGCNNNTSPCNSFAANGAGVNGSGILLGPTPLPVQLIRFQAYQVQGKVHLDWTTASEMRNRAFTVERSVDTRSWVEVDELPGMGTTQLITRYNAVDEEPLKGLSYYRLRQEDEDGTRTWSATVVVNFGSGGPGLEVFPNPAHDMIAVLFDPIMNGGTLHVVNDLGQRMDGPRKLENGRADLDVRAFPPGTYTVVLTRDDIGLRGRFVVKR